MNCNFHKKTTLKAIKILFEKVSNVYIKLGRPFLPITRLLRDPLKWYYHKSPLLRHDNKAYLRPWLLMLLHNTLIADHPYDFKIYRGKLKFRSYNTAMAIHGYYTGEIEYHLLRYVISQVRPDFVMIDVGAHHGAYALAVAYELRSNGWNGKIYCFEPDPFNFSLLQYNIRQNNLDDYIICQELAVVDFPGEKDFLIYRQENSANTLSCNTDMINQKLGVVVSQKVKVTTIDTFIDNFAHIDLIKMDIQGSEYQALAGATGVITRDRPVIVVEAVPGLETTEKIRGFLLNHNYSISGVTASSTLCSLGSNDAFVSWDWVALPNKY